MLLTASNYREAFHGLFLFTPHRLPGFLHRVIAYDTDTKIAYTFSNVHNPNYQDFSTGRALEKDLTAKELEQKLALLNDVEIIEGVEAGICYGCGRKARNQIKRIFGEDWYAAATSSTNAFYASRTRIVSATPHIEELVYEDTEVLNVMMFNDDNHKREWLKFYGFLRGNRGCDICGDDQISWVRQNKRGGMVCLECTAVEASDTK